MKARYRSADDCKPWNKGIEFSVQVVDGFLSEEDYPAIRPLEYAEISGWMLVGLEDE